MLVFFQLLEFGKVLGHLGIRKPFTIPSVIAHRQRNEVISHNATDIQVVMQVAQRLILEKFMFCVSYGLSGIRCLSPNQWEADTLPSGNADYVCQPDALTIPQFRPKVKCFF